MDGCYIKLEDLENMAKKKFDKLKVIELFACSVAQSIWGGVLTALNCRDGDLYDEKRGAFAEVKGAGDSQGAIIRKSQLKLHVKGLEHHNCEYVFVYYKNKGRHKGKYRSLTFLVGKTKSLLENFLTERTYEIYIVDATVVNVVY